MALTSTKFEDWTLLGAGRANTVFAYVGKRGDLVRLRSKCRFRKSVHDDARNPC